MPVLPLSASDRAHLPDEASEILRKILNGDILGASWAIRLIKKAFCLQADGSELTPGRELAHQVHTWADYLIQALGSLSPAVDNSIQLVLSGLEDAANQDQVEDVRTFLHTQSEKYSQCSQENVE